MKEMTSRERWKTTVELREADKVPVDFGGFISGIINAGPHGYKGLCEYMGIEDYETPAVAPVLNCVCNIDERILQQFGSDVRHIFVGGHPVKTLPNGLIRDDYGILLKESDFYFSIAHGQEPLREIKTVEELEEYPYWPDPDDPTYYAGVAEGAKKLRESTDKAIVAFPGYFGLIWHTYHFVRGFDTWLMDIKKNQELYRALADKILEINLAATEKYLKEVGPYIDGVLYGDDMGHQAAPYLSVKDYREMVKPWTKKWVSEVKRMVPHAKIQLHTCGSVYELIPDFIDCGFDIINPIQPLAANMAPAKLKKEFGDKVCLHGGCDIQRMLPFSKPAEVKKAVRQMIDTMSPGGGWILAASHNVEPETPPENIVAMFEAAQEYRNY